MTDRRLGSCLTHCPLCSVGRHPGVWHMPHVRISGADARHISRNSCGRLGKALSGLTLMEECNGSWPKSFFFSPTILGILGVFCNNTCSYWASYYKKKLPGIHNCTRHDAWSLHFRCSTVCVEFCMFFPCVIMWISSGVFLFSPTPPKTCLWITWLC